jgi:peroxiredoxin
VNLATLRQSKAFRIGGQLALVVVVVLAVRAFQTRGVARGTAPDLDAPGLDGTEVSLAAHRGEPVMVHFFATWCGVCRAEEHNVRAVAEDHAVIAIASRSGTDASVESYAREHGLEMPIVTDPRGAIAGAWGVSAFPTTFVLSPSGEIAHVEVGYTTELGLRARLALAGL